MTNTQTQLNELKLSYIEYLQDKQKCFNNGMNGKFYPDIRKGVCKKLGLLTKTGRCKNEQFLKKYFNQKGIQIRYKIQKILITLKEPVPQYRNVSNSSTFEDTTLRLINSYIVKFCMYDIKYNLA